MHKTIVWFRRDLRLHDNQALSEASRKGIIIPVFIFSEEDNLEYNEASLWWLHHSLLALQKSFQNIGSKLIIRKGKQLETLLELLRETKADAVFFNERYEHESIQRDKETIRELTKYNIETRTFHSQLIHDPYLILNQQQNPYKVFTPYWKRFLQEPIPRPLPKPPNIQSYSDGVSSLEVEQLGLLPTVSWHKKFIPYWNPGEKGAIEAWTRFKENDLTHYKVERDYPALQTVSSLSPHLAWGEISPRAIWYSVDHYLTISESEDYNSTLEESVEAFKRQLVWREFGYHQLLYYPTIATAPLRDQFLTYPWDNSNENFERWKQGLTGYPLIDAGMRQLWETGSIHNRVRMVVASFLVKHLMIDWTKGAKWFQHTLVDYDLANNSIGWQWVSGCGLDSSPYFRIFNPITQSEKFDKNGDYIRRWVPELSNLPVPYIHRPWDTPIDLLSSANIVLGKTYPKRIIEHDFARKRALAGYEMTSRKRKAHGAKQ